MLRYTPMGIIRRPSDGNGSKAPYTRIFIQCVNGWESMANEFWYHGLDSLCYNVRSTAQVEINPGTDVECVAENLTTNKRHIRIIGQYSVNESVQFTGFP